jgi:Flp pilus assembly protein TadD
MTAGRAGSWLAALLLVACAGARRAEGEAVRSASIAIAEELAGRGDWEAAFRAADTLARDDPSSTRARLLRARALRHRRMNVEAEADLRRVLELDPGSAAAHAELGVICELGRRPEEALLHHREAHRLAPGDARYLNNLAFALTLRGRPREAVPLLEEALRIEPGSARLRNNLGFAYAATGDFTRSAQQFTLGGGEAEAKNNLGLAYELSGNLAQAYELYLEAWRLAPAPRTRENLLHAARKLGRTVPPDLAVPATAEKGGT